MPSRAAVVAALATSCFGVGTGCVDKVRTPFEDMAAQADRVELPAQWILVSEDRRGGMPFSVGRIERVYGAGPSREELCSQLAELKDQVGEWERDTRSSLEWRCQWRGKLTPNFRERLLGSAYYGIAVRVEEQGQDPVVVVVVMHGRRS